MGFLDYSGCHARHAHEKPETVPLPPSGPSPCLLPNGLPARVKVQMSTRCTCSRIWPRYALQHHMANDKGDGLSARAAAAAHDDANDNSR
eukprot:scaffold10482_cov116-Isochrysis_galbana.AAC.8